MSVAKQFTYTHQEYFELEERSQIRHEYVCGQVYAMVGATDAHNQIAVNMLAFLHANLKGSGCRAYICDMKVRIEASNCFYYPDVMVTCEPYDAKSKFKTKPVLIVEILSESTSSIDRREKLVAYGLLSSLGEYLLVHQDMRKVELYRRTDAEAWSTVVYHDVDNVSLETLPNGKLIGPLKDIYAGVLE